MTRTTTQPQTPADPDPDTEEQATQASEPDRAREPDENVDTAKDAEEEREEEEEGEKGEGEKGETPSESGAAADADTDEDEDEDADTASDKDRDKDEPKGKGRGDKAAPAAKKPDAAGNGGHAGGGARRVAMVLTVVAALCAAWFGWSWYAAAHDESLAFSRERSEALQAGEQAVQNLNTLDYRSLDKGLKVWQDSTTNDLYQEIVRGRAAFEKATTEAKTITDAKVLDAAVTRLDQHAGKARVIVALEITVTPPKGEPTLKKTRMVGQLTRTATGWKLSALTEAPTGTSR